MSSCSSCKSCGSTCKKDNLVSLIKDFLEDYPQEKIVKITRNFKENTYTIKSLVGGEVFTREFKSSQIISFELSQGSYPSLSLGQLESLLKNTRDPNLTSWETSWQENRPSLKFGENDYIYL